MFSLNDSASLLLLEMPFAEVDDAHTELYYEDSGIPILHDRPYTTLVAVHGHSWNSHIFKRLIPLANASRIRLVLLNRRGYSASTPYSEDEMVSIDQDSASEHKETPHLEHSAFMQRRGVEIARFLAWFVENEQIPPLSDDKYGGVSLLGWSIGNSTTLSFLAYANTFDPGLIKKLESYLRRIIIYDPPHHALGYRTPENAYNPLFDRQISEYQRQSKFVNWISSYFIHSATSLDLDSSLRNPMDGLEQHSPDLLKPNSMSTFSSADIKTGLESERALTGDAFLLLPQAQPVHREVRLRAIFGDLNDTAVPVSLPKVGISYIWCKQSVWETVLAARLLKAEIASPPYHHYLVRSVKFFALEGNHYAHWDDPLKALAMFAAAME